MKNLKQKEIVKSWQLVDAKDKSLGRVSTQVAKMLMGKHKAIYTPHLDTGDNVVVINAKDVKLTGNKETQKIYYRHSGYPGGLYQRTAEKQRQMDPTKIVRKAVEGMLPKTNMGKTMIKKLYIFATSDHPYKNKIKNES